MSRIMGRYPKTRREVERPQTLILSVFYFKKPKSKEVKVCQAM
jgi:hypothetical protein